MLHASSPVLSTTSWSEAFFPNGDFDGDYHRSFIAFYSYVAYQVFIVASGRYQRLVRHSFFAFYSYYKYKLINISF